jgi:Ferritin-like
MVDPANAADATGVADARRQWTLEALREHLQAIVDLELWTIPYYLTAMYSIKDPSDDAYQLLQSVVYQEMLHTQLAGNLANAFELHPAFTAPVYAGHDIPHLRFRLDEPNPTRTYHPYSAELGPLDEPRVNAMCLIEYPEWRTGRTPSLQPNREEYGSIGELYAAVRAGIAALRGHLRGRTDQVDEFRNYYAGFSQPTITRDGPAGYPQAVTLIELITSQGEGQTQGEADVPLPFRNTADGFHERWPHFRKFSSIRAAGALPATFRGEALPPEGSPGHRAQQRLIRDFGDFLRLLEAMFRGERSPAFGPLMAKLGGDILTCWQHGAIPRFS